MTAPHDTHDTAPAQPCPNWRLVLADGRVVEVTIKERRIADGCAGWLAAIAGSNSMLRSGVGNTEEQAVRQLVGVVTGAREVVPPGQLTADERVAAERAAERCPRASDHDLACTGSVYTAKHKGG